MPKISDATRNKKLSARFIGEKCRAAIAGNKPPLSYIGFTSDVDDNGQVRVLAYGHTKGNPQAVTFVVLKEKAVLLAVLKNEVPAGYGDKEEEEIPEPKSGKKQ